MLVYPVAETSLREPIGLLLALVCALGWGGGTVYMKWARIKGDLLAITFWQVMVGAVAFAIFYLVFEGVPTFEPLQWRTWGGLLFNGVLGTGIAYFIWFNIIGRLSTAMASLGSLINPGGRRDRRRHHPRRPPDGAGHDRLRADLQRRRLRADPAAAEAAARSGVTAALYGFGIWISSVTCAGVSGAARNFCACASAMI